MTLQVDWRERDDHRPEDELVRLSPWFHNLHLPDGRQTAPDHPLGDFPAWKWQQLQSALPAQMDGLRALDIGCNAGFYSFELARRGAEVTALDIDPHYLRQARWAARELGLADRIEFRQGTVYDLARQTERFDIVLFLGVLYHLRHPLLALDLVARRVGRVLVLQTLTLPSQAGPEAPQDLSLDERYRLLEPGWPRAAFIEHQMAGDPTNWWALDDNCVRAMIRSSGLRVVATPGHELYVCEPAEGEERAAGGTAQLRESELSAIFGAGPSQRK